MKRFEDDKKIVNAVQENENYQIKTTADSILAAYQKRQQASKPHPSFLPKKKKTGWFVGIPLVGALTAAGICLGIFLHPSSPSSPVPYAPDNSPTVLRELVSFASFNGGQSSSLAPKAKKLNLLSETEDYLEPLKKAASRLDEYFDFFTSCYEFTPNDLVISSEKLKEPYTLKDESYDYVSHYSYLNKEVFSFYYGDLSSLENPTSSTFSGVFVQGDSSYKTTIKKEVEKEESEVEEEISMEFVNTSFPWDVFVVEKANETEEGESENSFCLKKYLGIDALTREDPTVSFTYEFECDEEGTETSFEIQVGNNEFSFEHITYSQNVYTFDVEVKIPPVEITFKEVKVYVGDATRSYIYNSQKINF